MRSLLGGMTIALLAGVSFFFRSNPHRSLAPIPFDPNLSLSVVVEGDFTSFWHGQAHLVLTPTVTAYRPDEDFQILEIELEPDEWAERLVQSFDPAQLPQGWIYFAPVSELTMKVTVSDQQARLLKLVVKTWDGQTVGEIPASPDRRTISGKVVYGPDIDLFVLEIWGQGSQEKLLARGVPRTPRAMDGFFYDTSFGFRPHPDNPRSTEGVLAGAKVPLTSTHTLRVTYQDNDSPDAKPEPPRGEFGDLQTKELVKDTIKEDHIPPNVIKEGKLLKEIANFRNEFKSNEKALAHAIIPPFSQEIEAIWQFSTKGRGCAWIVIPYYDVPERKLKVELELGGKIQGAAPPPKETSEVAIQWVFQIKLTEEEKRKLQIGDPIAIGDIWGIEVMSPPIFPIVTAKSILQNLTVRVDRDKICVPAVGGSVSLEMKEALPHVGYYTDPRTGKRERIPPPYNPPAPDSVSLDQNGVGSVQVPKGFRYLFKNPTLKTFPAIYEITPSEQTKDVPPTTNVTFDDKLTNLAMLKVYVYTQPSGQEWATKVELYKLPGETLVLTSDISEVVENGNKYYVASFENVPLGKQPDGTYRAIYRVKAHLLISIPHTPYDSGPVTFNPGCEKKMTATIQPKVGEGPGADGG